MSMDDGTSGVFKRADSEVARISHADRMKGVDLKERC